MSQVQPGCSPAAHTCHQACYLPTLHLQVDMGGPPLRRSVRLLNVGTERARFTVTCTEPLLRWGHPHLHPGPTLICTQEALLHDLHALGSSPGLVTAQAPALGVQQQPPGPLAMLPSTRACTSACPALHVQARPPPPTPAENACCMQP